MSNRALNSFQEKCVVKIMAATDWSREAVIEHVEDAHIRMGITYADYTQYRFWTVPVEKQGIKYKLILNERMERRVNFARGTAKYVAKVMAKTGWSFEYAEAQILDAQKRTECNFKEYYVYRMYEMTHEEQARVFVSRVAKKIKKYNVNNEWFRTIIYDKTKTNEYFSEFLTRPWCVNNRIEKDNFVRLFKDSTRIIYKPAKGLQGKSVMAFAVDPSNIDSVYEQVASLPVGVVEEYVVQHPKMSAMCPSSVNTIRVCTISSYSKPVSKGGNYLEIPYATLRVGNGMAVVDNFHSGGMAAAIDLKTGKLVTNGANEEGETFEKHPVTGVTFKGFEIPFFAEAIDFVKEMCEKKRVEGYIGWDIAITEDGPVMIEVGSSPGAVLLTAPYIDEKCDTMHIMEKYL